MNLLVKIVAVIDTNKTTRNSRVGRMPALFMQYHRIVRNNVDCILNHAANSELRVTETDSLRIVFILSIAYRDCLKVLQYCVSVLLVRSDAKKFRVDNKVDPLVCVLF